MYIVDVTIFVIINSISSNFIVIGPDDTFKIFMLDVDTRIDDCDPDFF